MKIAHTSSALVAALVLLSVAPQVRSATYDFSGTVTLTSGIYSSIPIGSAITGTYTFDLSNASPSQSSGVTGSSAASWDAELFGGSFYVGSPPPVDSLIFSSTASVDGLSYASLPPSAYLTSSRVLATVPGIPGAPVEYEADELVCISSASCHSSDLFGGNQGAPEFTTDGLPNFSANPAGWRGEFATGPQSTSTDYLQYSVNSISPVPLPSSITLFGLGLAGLSLHGVWLRRRQREA